MITSIFKLLISSFSCVSYGRPNIEGNHQHYTRHQGWTEISGISVWKYNQRYLSRLERKKRMTCCSLSGCKALACNVVLIPGPSTLQVKFEPSMKSRWKHCIKRLYSSEIYLYVIKFVWCKKTSKIDRQNRLEWEEKRQLIKLW